MSNLLLTTEQACSNLAQSASVSQYEGLFSKVQYFTGIDDEVKKAPAVVCAALDATPDSDNPNVGVYHVRASIIVKERAATTTTDTTLADTIFRQFQTGSVEQDLTRNASGYYVYFVREESQTSGVEGKMWVETLNLLITCAKTQ